MIFFNGNFYNEKIPFRVNEGLMYGQGVFETLKVTDGKIEFFNMHYERLLEGCKILNINFDYSEKKLLNTSNEVININKDFNGSLKINVLKNRNSYDIIISSSAKKYNKKLKNEGYKVIFAENRRFSKNILNRIKSNNYYINILELERAKKLNKNEAIFLNEKDEITEGTVSNVFFVKDNEIYTPTLSCGLLNGIIRKILITEFNVKEVIIKKEDVYEFDFAFLTNSLMRIMPIKIFEDIEYNFDYNYIQDLEYNIINLGFK
ncbi:4-amino-4-deoxychorismate lyase [Marinitoga hydrogenitolerans DSM 16785]|uniref:4-amino-4-deoxychorismate lyase n=1 Tax=Marinitoga hydrogenitolerans (strain DSM 16785 / JCM 12826 / AT1271) TaxID=1122195 RepID=A0A1M4YE06_MARH1|nr:aminotransferase class IV [Marinitoga hydrogenitolerans]SHF03868.1 4-amino-4-deoxychorismate lyase [Marinitoga hydrogenitolerans DSM 16785]